MVDKVGLAVRPQEASLEADVSVLIAKVRCGGASDFAESAYFEPFPERKVKLGENLSDGHYVHLLITILGGRKWEEETERREIQIFPRFSYDYLVWSSP